MISFEKDHEVIFPVQKLIIVAPLSCNVENTLTDKDSSIEYYKNLPCIECDQGANVNREYKTPVYIIHSVKVRFVYACFVFASVKMIISKINCLRLLSLTQKKKELYLMCVYG